jgi:predicted HTH transcriptional regulator
VSELTDNVSQSSHDIKRLLALYRLVHAKEIEQRKQEILEPKARSQVYDLCKEPRSAKYIAEKLKTKPQNINYHLVLLVEAGLLDFELRENEKVYYQAI